MNGTGAESPILIDLDRIADVEVTKTARWSLENHPDGTVTLTILGTTASIELSSAEARLMAQLLVSSCAKAVRAA